MVAHCRPIANTHAPRLGAAMLRGGGRDDRLGAMQEHKSLSDEFSNLVSGAVSSVASLSRLAPEFERAAALLVRTLQEGRKVLAAGNGGSAAEAMHLAEELSGRYRSNRRALPGLALCADCTALTCIGNDFGFDEVFSRQIEAFATDGDLVALFTTSGNSENLLRAARAARARGASVLSFTGPGGGALAGLSDILLAVPEADRSAHVQEAHQVLLHALLEKVETAFPASHTETTTT